MRTQPIYYSGTKIAGLMQSQGLRQDWVAKEAGISAAHLSRIASGKRLASETVANEIARVLRVPLFLAFELPIGSDSLPIDPSRSTLEIAS